MKQSLQVRLGQQLAMTPQLQQAIRLLQLSSLDLQMEIQQALDSNLMLEAAEDSDTSSEEDMRADNEAEVEAQTRSEPEADAEREGEHAEPTSEGSRDDIPEDLPLDTDWDAIYDGASASSGSSGSSDPDAHQKMLENQSEGSGDLREHLLWQANLSRFSERDTLLAEAIIDAINDDGYLATPLEELRESMPAEWDVEADEMEMVLHRIQHFDPIGVGAQNLREALSIQLRNLETDSPWLGRARELVENHLDLLGNRQYAQIMRRMKLSEAELGEVVSLIQTLNPRPGSQCGSQRTEYVIPDVFVRKVKGEWRVDLNAESAPKIRINNYYASLIKRADSSADNTTLRNHLQEARWFLKSLQSRNETLLKVARCIVKHQRRYFDEGEEAMEPLVLREVAEEVEMHESTISRITTQKYMHTPRGTLEFKYFFSSHVQTVDGGECSATAIRARIRRLIAAEDCSRPLSDSRLAEMLRDEGIDVARRTVAKYREAMSIASSTERKRLTPR